MLVKALQAWESISNIKRNGTVCIASGSGLLYLHHYLTYKITRVILYSEKNRTQEIIPFNNNKFPTNKSISWEIHICGNWNVRQGALRMNPANSQTHTYKVWDDKLTKHHANTYLIKWHFVFFIRCGLTRNKLKMIFGQQELLWLSLL